LKDKKLVWDKLKNPEFIPAFQVTKRLPQNTPNTYNAD